MRGAGTRDPAITGARSLAAFAACVFCACPAGRNAADREPPVIERAQPGPLRQYCQANVAGPLRISEDSIGPLDLEAPLERLRGLCPAARDTVWYGRESASPAVFFPFSGLSVFAVQDQDSLLLEAPADGWEVRETNGLLFGQLPLTAPWVDLQRAFGPGIASRANTSTDEKVVTVMFCSHPRAFLVLRAPPESVTPGSRADLSRIPSLATVVQVAIYPRPNPTWTC
jgi:hypothetical protein